MFSEKLKILKHEYFTAYKTQRKVELESAYIALKNSTQKGYDFNFYFANSAVHSSNIEGNSIDFDSYLKTKEFNLHLQTKELKEIEELIATYQFAKENKLSLETVLKSHEMATQSILIKKERGKIRKVKVGIRSEGRLIYLAIEPENIQKELEKLFEDIEMLLENNLSIEDVFYYAAFIHLVFVNIHPFVDGNGRATRLLEKWFLAKKLGEMAWCIPSEKNYWDNRAVYYKNLQLGVNYYEINYAKSVPFLLMLPNALSNFV